MVVAAMNCLYILLIFQSLTCRKVHSLFYKWLFTPMWGVANHQIPGRDPMLTKETVYFEHPLFYKRIAVKAKVPLLGQIFCLGPATVIQYSTRMILWKIEQYVREITERYLIPVKVVSCIRSLRRYPLL
jgi:hypothetical protein